MNKVTRAIWVKFVLRQNGCAVPRRSQILRSAIRRCLLGGLLVVLCLGQIAGFLMATEQFARGYADPGSGFLALQILGASLAGWSYLIRRKLRSFFGESTDVMSGKLEIGNPLRASNDAPINNDTDKTR
jgi:hypothetical protein